MKICMCCTKNWYYYLTIDVFALLNTNKVSVVYLFIEDNEIEEIKELENKFNVKIVFINYLTLLPKYLEKNSPNKDTEYSLASIARLFIPFVLEEKKILYLDVDAIVLQDISELWNININDYCVAGVKDLKSDEFRDYLDLMGIRNDCVNAGILLMNLEKIRKDNKDAMMLKCLNETKYKFADQDIINKVLGKKILYLDNKYNSSYSTGLSNNIKIMHYAFKKDHWISKHINNNLWYEWEKKYNNYKKS